MKRLVVSLALWWAILTGLQDVDVVRLVFGPFNSQISCVTFLRTAVRTFDGPASTLPSISGWCVDPYAREWAQ